MTNSSNIKVVLTGPDKYWMGVAGYLLELAGIAYDCLTTRRQLIGLFLTGNWRRYDYIYQVNGTRNWLAAFLLGLTGKPFIIHWIGTDIVSFRSGKASRTWRRWLTYRLVYRCGNIHLADSPELRQELDNIGVASSVVRLLPRHITAQPAALPAKCTVLSYWAEKRYKFYGGDIVLRLAHNFPELHFNVLGTTQAPPNSPANVNFLGRRQDIEDIYNRSTVLVRLPEHDSLSAMVLEMLARGRYVIYNKHIPHCHYAENYEQARLALQEIRQRTKPNLAGAAYVKENYSPADQANTLSRLLKG